MEKGYDKMEEKREKKGETREREENETGNRKWKVERKGRRQAHLAD